MLKKMVIGAVVLILILTLIYFESGQHISDQTPNCKLLEPLPAETLAHYRDLDFSDKTRLSPNKFGFRRKLVISEDSIVIQQVGGPSNSNAYYGIYRDEELKEPVEAADFAWLYRDGDFEEGKTDTVPYDEKKDGIVVLEPGTYYAAVYTKSPFDDFEATYLSYICPLNEWCKLREDESKKFYVIKEGQKNTFEIRSKKEGKVRLKTNIYNQGTIKIYDGNRVLLDKKTARKNSEEPITVIFNAEKEQTYYVEIEDCEISTDAFMMYLYEIKYTFI